METAKRLAEEDRAGQSIDRLKESERELTGLFGSLLDTMRPDGDSVEKADAERIRKVGGAWLTQLPPMPAEAAGFESVRRAGARMLAQADLVTAAGFGGGS